MHYFHMKKVNEAQSHYQIIQMYSLNKLKTFNILVQEVIPILFI